MSSIPRFFCLLALLILGAACESGRPDEFVRYDERLYERVSLHYELFGIQDTTLVFIHDWNLSMRYWDEPVSKLRSQYRILNVDLAGHGNSGRARKYWTIESFARDIANLLEKENLTKCVLIGHGLGAEVALQMTDYVPERVAGLVAVEAFKNLDFVATDEFVEDFLDNLKDFKANYPTMADALARERIRSRDRVVINRIVRDYRRADPKIALEIYKNRVPKQEEARQQVARFPGKIYLIQSRYDPANEEAIARHAKGGYAIRWMEDGGYFPMVERPQQFVAALRSVLADIGEVREDSL